MDTIKLTQYSHGAGCGCKISPAVLDTILHSDQVKFQFPGLLVGNESKDDAAVFDLGDGMCVISTTDFFMPIVDDPFTFGSIASVNAISDIYAMGGTPLMAVAILGWPISKIPAEVAQQVLEGSRNVCAKAGIPLAGGHSIDSPEPIFGLAVTGIVRNENLKKNSTAKEGNLLYLTKPIGVGMITTALKRGLALPEDFEEAVQVMSQLNDLGKDLGKLDHVKALTDVTGFGLLNQREVHRDTLGFNEALRSALREDPDCILVGEMRDLETIRLALSGAETGHLVFGTLHTSSAAKTIDRIVDVFPAAEKDMVRAMLSESLRSVISQTLCKKVGGGRQACHEIMMGTPAIRNLIREAKIAQMYSAIQTGQQYGMQTLDQNLAEYVKKGVITKEEAASKAQNKDNFK